MWESFSFGCRASLVLFFYNVIFRFFLFLGSCGWWVEMLLTMFGSICAINYDEREERRFGCFLCDGWRNWQEGKRV